MPALEVDLCVIGAGAAGLTVAAGAAQMGASTVLVEHAAMGGDCLNYGCVPSKALLAAAHAAEAARQAGRFGIRPGTPAIDALAVRDHLRGVIMAIAPNDSVERFEGLGVTVLRSTARFVDPRTIVAGDTRITARRFVVAAGSSPAVPPIPGLSELPYLTNETLFDLDRMPNHLIVIGGGPIGIEMAQAYRRLGARVTVVEATEILPRDDRDLVSVVRERLRAEGIVLLEGARVTGASRAADGLGITLAAGDGENRSITGSHLLVATGRRANVEELNLERAGIAYTSGGIAVDARLRTTNRRVFAIGDIVDGPRFTHVAAYHASVVLRNALFRIPTRVAYRCVPHVTFADPEVAQVGATEAEARERHRRIRVLRGPFADNDRAQAERRTDGLVKVVVTPRGTILGAGIVGAAAGELIQTWTLAMHRRLRIGALATMIAPYPTFGLINKQVAGSFYTPALYSERMRRLVRLLARFG
jgi:pyruvate/2-oxoglutarate dehydrogenase complex dihydrolipoamide dehydrogenase (E3) component